jgi:hypothetical protein
MLSLYNEGITFSSIIMVELLGDYLHPPSDGISLIKGSNLIPLTSIVLLIITLNLKVQNIGLLKMKIHNIYSTNRYRVSLLTTSISQIKRSDLKIISTNRALHSQSKPLVQADLVKIVSTRHNSDLLSDTKCLKTYRTVL